MGKSRGRAREEGILKQQEHLNGMNSKYAKKTDK